MAYKLGFILSSIFIVALFVMYGDIMAVQVIYTNLDAISVTAGYLISSKGKITDEVILLAEQEANAIIEPVGDQTPMFGSIYEYKIYTYYTPNIIADHDLEVSIIRSVVIGYYSWKEEVYVWN